MSGDNYRVMKIYEEREGHWTALKKEEEGQKKGNIHINESGGLSFMCNKSGLGPAAGRE